MNENNNKRGLKQYLMLTLGLIGISVSSILVRYSQAPSPVTAAIRLCWTVLLLTPAVLLNKTHRNELFSIDKRTLLLSSASGALLAFHFTTWFESLKHTTVASATIIVCTEMIWVAIGYVIFMHGHVSLSAIGCMSLGFLGSIIIALSDRKGGGDNLKGDIFALVAAIAVGAYTLLGREVRSTVSTAVYTYICYVSCCVFLLLTCLILNYPLFGYGTSPIISGLALAVFSTLMGHSVFSWCLAYFSPAFVSATKLCEPVVAGALAAVLFSEIPSTMQIIGGILVIIGVILYARIEISGNDENKERNTADEH